MQGETLTAQEIEDQLVLRRQRFEQVVGDIRTLLRADLEQFAVRETRRVFLAEAPVASLLSLEQVRALRAGAASLGRRLAEETLSSLADMRLWESAAAIDVGGASPSRDLSGVEAVWCHVRAAEAEIGRYLEGHGFHPEPPVTYRIPAFFVAGLYMPGLVEHFWRTLAEIRELEQQREALVERAARERLLAVWDASERA